MPFFNRNTLRKSPFEQDISLKNVVRNPFLSFQSCFLEGFSMKHLGATKKKKKLADNKFLLSFPYQYVQILKLILIGSVHGHIQCLNHFSFKLEDLGAIFQYLKDCNFSSSIFAVKPVIINYQHHPFCWF